MRGSTAGRVTRGWARRARWAGVALTAACLALPVTSAQAVSGGSSVMSASQFPYMVSVQGPVVMCEGALVDLKHVVTTATCVSALAPSDVNVRVGSNKYYDGGLSEAVTVITVHPAFDKSTYDSNIAVLTLARTLPMRHVDQADPPCRERSPGREPRRRHQLRRDEHRKRLARPLAASATHHTLRHPMPELQRREGHHPYDVRMRRPDRRQGPLSGRPGHPTRLPG